MITRTSKRTVTFKRPFMIGDLDKALPTGDYVVETYEELLNGLSFPAYRRTLTLIYPHQTSRIPSQRQVLQIDPGELDAALLRDQSADDQPADASARPGFVERG